MSDNATALIALLIICAAFVAYRWVTHPHFDQEAGSATPPTDAEPDAREDEHRQNLSEIRAGLDEIREQLGEAQAVLDRWTKQGADR